MASDSGRWNLRYRKAIGKFTKGDHFRQVSNCETRNPKTYKGKKSTCAAEKKPRRSRLVTALQLSQSDRQQGILLFFNNATIYPEGCKNKPFHLTPLMFPTPINILALLDFSPFGLLFINQYNINSLGLCAFRIDTRMGFFSAWQIKNSCLLLDHVSSQHVASEEIQQHRRVFILVPLVLNFVTTLKKRGKNCSHSGQCSANLLWSLHPERIHTSKNSQIRKTARGVSFSNL